MRIFTGTPKGDEAEERFLRIAKTRTRATPSWYVDTKRASPMFDMKGLDMIARIRRDDDKKPMSVPIQVKSSSRGRRAYYAVHPEAKEVGVIIMVVHDGLSDDEIRSRLYRHLRPFLSVRRDHFKKYLHRLGRSRVSDRGRAIRDMIAESRKKS